MSGLPVSRLMILAIRNSLRNRRRSLLTIFSVLIGVSSCLILAALSRGMGKQLIDDAIYNLTGHIQIHAPGYRDDPAVEYLMSEPSADLLTALQNPEILAWSQRTRFPAVLRSERESLGVSFIGIDPGTEKGVSFIGDGVSAGVYLQDSQDSGLVVGEKLLELLQTEIGKRVVLMSQDSQGQISDRGFRIIGSYRSELESNEKLYVFTGIRTAQKMLSIEGKIAEIAIRLKSDKELDGVQERLKAATDYEVAGWRELSPLVDAMTRIQDGFLIIWYFIVIITVCFGLINTLFMGIYERTRELGIIQAIGMSPTAIMAQIVLESLFLLSIGAFSGAVAGIAACKYFALKGIDISEFSAGADVVGLSNIIYPNLITFDLLLINLLIVCIGVLGAIYPAYFAARLSPAKAMSQGAR